MQEAAPRAGEQFLLTTKMVMSDGIPLLLALARMESQEIAGLSVAMLQRILSYDTRYKRVVLSVTKDPELIRLIEEGERAAFVTDILCLTSSMKSKRLTKQRAAIVCLEG